MKKLLFVIFVMSFLSTSCHNQKLHVFGININDTYEKFITNVHKQEGYRTFPTTLHFDSIAHNSKDTVEIFAHNTTIADLNENIYTTDSLYIRILLTKGHIHEFSYKLRMPLCEYNAIRSAHERIYGDTDYYDIGESQIVCGWRIGKHYMYLNYDTSKCATKYIYLIN